jgi:UDPglucose--hexose-1-phosphate uridylyltransferase
MLELTAPGPCHLCGHRPGDRGVAAVGGWQGVGAGAAEWPYALLLAPVDHVADLPAVADEGRDSLAGLLVDVLGRLDRLFDAPMPYMLWIHQRPTDGGTWPTSHVHVHVAPLLRSPGVPRFVAAGELGSGTYFNPVDPAAAAGALREA